MNKFYLIFDTETANSLDDPIVYDIGFSIIDETGRSYASYSYIVKDVFYNSELMSSAYFAEKIPQYVEDLRAGRRTARYFWQIKRKVREVMRHYGITEVIAHNCRFDYLSTNTTQRYLTKSKVRYFFPYGTQYIDTLKMARQTFGKDEHYVNYCMENDYCTTKKQPRLTAEILYRYIVGDNNFVESHTALEDVNIEKVIFSECLKRNREVEKYLW